MKKIEVGKIMSLYLTADVKSRLQSYVDLLGAEDANFSSIVRDILSIGLDVIERRRRRQQSAA